MILRHRIGRHTNVTSARLSRDMNASEAFATVGVVQGFGANAVDDQGQSYSLAGIGGVSKELHINIDRANQRTLSFRTCTLGLGSLWTEIDLLGAK